MKQLYNRTTYTRDINFSCFRNEYTMVVSWKADTQGVSPTLALILFQGFPRALLFNSLSNDPVLSQITGADLSRTPQSHFPHFLSLFFISRLYWLIPGVIHVVYSLGPTVCFPPKSFRCIHSTAKIHFSSVSFTTPVLHINPLCPHACTEPWDFLTSFTQSFPLSYSESFSPLHFWVHFLALLSFHEQW